MLQAITHLLTSRGTGLFKCCRKACLPPLVRNFSWHGTIASQSQPRMRSIAASYLPVSHIDIAILRCFSRDTYFPEAVHLFFRSEQPNSKNIMCGWTSRNCLYAFKLAYELAPSARCSEQTFISVSTNVRNQLSTAIYLCPRSASESKMVYLQRKDAST